MTRPITELPPNVAEKAWKLAGRIEWTVEDWKDFYHSMTAVFVRIAARHAGQAIAKATGENVT